MHLFFKKQAYKRTHTVQTCTVHGSTAEAMKDYQFYLGQSVDESSRKLAVGILTVAQTMKPRAKWECGFKMRCHQNKREKRKESGTPLCLREEKGLRG